MKKPRYLNKYIGDGLLIIFSVLLALMINKSFEAYQVRKQTASARQAIAEELTRNDIITNQLLEIHQSILKSVIDLVEGKDDSLRLALRSKSYFDIWILTGNRSIAPEFPASTAWETARATGILSEFDYTEIVELTRIYEQQAIIYGGTMKGIIDVTFDRDTNDLRNLEATLLQFRIRFNELCLQEKTLKAYYNVWMKNQK